MTNYKVKVLTIEEATEILRAAGLSISPDGKKNSVEKAKNELCRFAAPAEFRKENT